MGMSFNHDSLHTDGVGEVSISSEKKSTKRNTQSLPSQTPHGGLCCIYVQYFVYKYKSEFPILGSFALIDSTIQR
jgi:hypothetical protein